MPSLISIKNRILQPGLILVELLFFSCLTIISHRQTEGVENVTSSAVQDYVDKICKGTPTCNLTNTVSREYRNLNVRNCMCDEQCLIYNDCCEDAVISNVTLPTKNATQFECVPTFSKDHVYIINTCPESWNISNTPTGFDVKDNCETQNVQFLQVDVLLSTHVTSFSGTTYRNMFCALCHQEVNFTFWDLHLTYELMQKALLNQTDNESNETTTEPMEFAMSSANPTSISDFFNNETTIKVLNGSPSLTADTIFPIEINDDYFFQFTYQNQTYKLFLHAVVPENLTNLVRYCVPKVVTTCSSSECGQPTSYVHTKNQVYKNQACSACNRISSEDLICRAPYKAIHLNPALQISITDDRVMKVPMRCQQMPSTLFAFDLFCPKPHNQRVSTEESSSSSTCFPFRKDNGKPCLLNKIYPIDVVNIIDNVSVYYRAVDTEYPNAEWNKNETHIYICGTFLKTSRIQMVIEILDDILTSVLIKISMLCLVLQLVMFQQLPELKNLSGKNLAAFCGTLLVAFICFDIGPWLPSCNVTAAIAHYAFLSCFTWMLVMSYDCWLSLYRATAKFRTSGGKHATKFALYCIICWTLPLAVIIPSVYLELTDSVECSLKLGYGVSKDCWIFSKNMQYVLFFLPASIMFLGNIGFFAHTAYMIYHTQKKTVNPNTRNDFRLYTRLALLMGLTWTLGSIAQITSSGIIGLLFSLMNMSQGMFIFFGFTFKKKTLRSLLEKHKDSRFVSTTLVTLVSPHDNKVHSETPSKSQSTVTTTTTTTTITTNGL